MKYNFYFHEVPSKIVHIFTEVMFTKQINERHFWKSFFAFYRNYPEIWDPRCDKYSIKEYKDIAYQALVTKMREIDPNASIDSVKRKLNIFKSNYKREQKRRRITGSKSKLWYYNDLSFLPEMDRNSELTEVPSKSDSSDFDISELTGSITPVKSENLDNILTDSSSASGYVPNFSQDVNTFNSQANGYLPLTPQTNGYPPIQESSVPKSEPSDHDSSFHEDDTMGYQPIEPTVKLNERSAMNDPQIREREDDADVFSRSWATLYRRIPESQQLLAKKLIDDILYEGCLGRLEEGKK